jgi:3-oxoacyl-[acyl-carrier protein] reductase
VKAALVTGGSSGIGLAIARMLREEGYDVTVASRRQERVDAAADELGAFGSSTRRWRRGRACRPRT